MGGHDAAGSWLDRWRDQEPLRLYLWTTASAVLAGGVVAGWWTRDVSLAIAGPVAAALMVGGTAKARSVAYAPATVEQIEDSWRDHEDRAVDEAVQDQHETSWQDGWEDGWQAGVEAVGKAAEETGRTPEKVAAEMRAAPATTALAAQQPCGYVEDPPDGPRRRCTLPRHPEGFPHRLEASEGEE